MKTRSRPLWGGASDTSPLDENIVLYGTGDHLYRRGTGLWRTADGGTSWHPNLHKRHIFMILFLAKQIQKYGHLAMQSSLQMIRNHLEDTYER
ncbi:MAG: hypothetical protein IPG00_14275 [Saprospiraceae bacterium]|nr:hypothetical protein [Saprospiraceae bacterium]